ncbi:deoxyribonuclease 1 like 4, tandem duplicate 2 [Clupea harengus]|uniref:Deoxyribonuclease n=1 Tax=Clupea harengus TaxID=7950 RepID=A0A8M1K916_CLUHA|nr:deoxyribonuclease 1 like 4, tandem duplicate 2 [Clupea harengus]XP_042560541.1 deoxyribonuclease 1 like 4, tandem duplicate 2 [Clupea harengus]XP_042560542.1 deoxyribonuclease 1 like 4, tandem duplicate 2 [Clupea harengus]
MKVASFNVRRLGLTKVSDENVLRYLIKIVSRYSIIMILEVVDKSGKAMAKFLRELNNTRANKKHPYAMEVSSSLGRSHYKEQFVCLYREDQVQLTDTYQYEDNQVGDEDAFSREPFILRFSSPLTELKDFVLIPVHTKPDDSEKELDELYDVFQEVKRRWKTDDIMILGDFNADGAYVSKRKMKRIRIRSDTDFHWLIGDDIDTTARTSNDHTYDRIVVYQKDMLQAVVPHSAKAFNFHDAYNLSEEMALSISDHYPVEVTLRPAKRARKRRRQ